MILERPMIKVPTTLSIAPSIHEEEPEDFSAIDY